MDLVSFSSLTICSFSLPLVDVLRWDATGFGVDVSVDLGSFSDPDICGKSCLSVCFEVALLLVLPTTSSAGSRDGLLLPPAVLDVNFTAGSFSGDDLLDVGLIADSFRAFFVSVGFSVESGFSSVPKLGDAWE